MGRKHYRLTNLIIGSKTIISLMIILGFLIFFIIFFSIWNVSLIDFKNDQEYGIRILRDMVINLTVLIGILTALIIPLKMKVFNDLEKEQNEDQKIIGAFNRIKSYLKQEAIGFREGRFYSREMSFFRIMNQIYPEILLKLGIEVGTIEKEGIKYTELYILDKYKLTISMEFKIIIQKTNLYSLIEDVELNIDFAEHLLEEIKKNYEANTKRHIKLSTKLEE